jgi:hypothetical protein
MREHPRCRRPTLIWKFHWLQPKLWILNLVSAPCADRLEQEPYSCGFGEPPWSSQLWVVAVKLDVERRVWFWTHIKSAWCGRQRWHDYRLAGGNRGWWQATRVLNHGIRIPENIWTWTAGWSVMESWIRSGFCHTSKILLSNSTLQYLWCWSARGLNEHLDGRIPSIIVILILTIFNMPKVITCDRIAATERIDQSRVATSLVTGTTYA